MTNMTYAMALDFATEMIANGNANFNGFSANDYLEKLEALKTQLAKRGSSKTPTKTQKENEKIKEIIFEVLSESETPMRVKDMLADDLLSQYSSSKITALLKQMLPDTGDGRVIRTLEKKVAYFTTVE